MALKLKPVRMKNSLYLLVPKGISELLELDDTRECILTTGTEQAGPILKYSFSSPALPPKNEDGPTGRKHAPKRPGVLRETPV